MKELFNGRAVTSKKGKERITKYLTNMLDGTIAVIKVVKVMHFKIEPE